MIVRNQRRKLFNRERKKTFLEFFAATGNLGWAAEEAGICRQTVSKHLMSDPEFGAAYEEALNVSRLRLKSSLVEIKKPEQPIVIDGTVEVPEIDMPFEQKIAVLREMEREVKIGRRRGRTPQIAPNAQLFKALHQALIGFEKEMRRLGGGEGAR